MKSHIYEHAGVNFRVEYDVDADKCINFFSIHVMDANYRVVGPDLGPLLDGLLVLTSTTPPEATPLLSEIARDINEERK